MVNIHGQHLYRELNYFLQGNLTILREQPKFPYCLKKIELKQLNNFVIYKKGLAVTKGLRTTGLLSESCFFVVASYITKKSFDQHRIVCFSIEANVLLLRLTKTSAIIEVNSSLEKTLLTSTANCNHFLIRKGQVQNLVIF